MSRTLERFIIFWSWRQSSQIERIISSWFISHSLRSTGIELGWFPKNVVMRIVKSSSISKVPRSTFIWLSARSKYSGHCCRGTSRRILTFLKWDVSDRIIRISTTSGDDQTSIRVAETSVDPLISGSSPILLPNLEKAKVLSSPEM